MVACVNPLPNAANDQDLLEQVHLLLQFGSGFFGRLAQFWNHSHNIWFKFWHSRGGILVAAGHVNRFRCFWLVPGVPPTLLRHAIKEKGNSLLIHAPRETLESTTHRHISSHPPKLTPMQQKQQAATDSSKHRSKWYLVSRDINRVKLDHLLANVFDAVVKGLQQLKILR